MTDTTHYRSYLLRCWSEETGGALQWRYALDSTQTQQRVNFADLRQLVSFLTQIDAVESIETDTAP